METTKGAIEPRPADVDRFLTNAAFAGLRLIAVEQTIPPRD